MSVADVSLDKKGSFVTLCNTLPPTVSTMLVFALTLLPPRVAPPTPVVMMSGTADPFRPQRPPLEPMIINAIQDLLRGKEPNAVAERAVQAPHHVTTHLLHTDQAQPVGTLSLAHLNTLHVQGRRADPDYELADSEER